MIVVYTAILGGSDSLKPAPAGADRAVCFVTDPSTIPDSKGWELIAHEARNPRREAWRLRCLPHELFEDYSRVVWIDASFTLTDLPRLIQDARTAPIAALRHHERNSCYREAARLAQVGQSDPSDITRQISAYQQARFRSRHLSISCILVRDRSEPVQQFNETWIDQIVKYPGDNTQVSLDYSAWVHGLTIRALEGTRHKNPYATHDHRDHKRRRKPYDKPQVAA